MKCKKTSNDNGVSELIAQCVAFVARREGITEEEVIARAKAERERIKKLESKLRWEAAERLIIP